MNLQTQALKAKSKQLEAECEILAQMLTRTNAVAEGLACMAAAFAFTAGLRGVEVALTDWYEATSAVA